MQLLFNTLLKPLSQNPTQQCHTAAHQVIKQIVPLHNSRQWQQQQLLCHMQCCLAGVIS